MKGVKFELHFRVANDLGFSVNLFDDEVGFEISSKASIHADVFSRHEVPNGLDFYRLHNVQSARASSIVSLAQRWG